MAEIINLNKARKAKLKAEKQQKAAGNRVAFGLSTKLRNLNRRQDDQAKSRHEAHRLTKPDDGSSTPEERGSGPSQTPE